MYVDRDVINVEIRKLDDLDTLYSIEINIAMSFKFKNIQLPTLLFLQICLLKF